MTLDERVAALVEGRLAPEQLEACLSHLAGCDACAAPLVSVRVLKTAGVCSGSALRDFVSETMRLPS